MSDKAEKALAVALDVSTRRARGENISDADVLRQHADLSPDLERELNKLRMVSNARQQGQNLGNVDVRFTTMVTDDEEDEAIPETGFVDPSAADAPKKITRTKPYRPLARPAMAMLRVYHDNQREYVSHFLTSESTVIGRVSGDLVIDHDPLISSKHVEIQRVEKGERWEWYLKDLDSTNGTFVSVDRAKLNEGDEVLLGSQRYRFRLAGNEASLEHLVGSEVADSMELSPEGTLVGRDKSDQMSAFWDEFLDAKHAFIQMERDQTWQIANTKSVNGVWYRVSSLRLFRSCFFQIGGQRFGFRS